MNTNLTEKQLNRTKKAYALVFGIIFLLSLFAQLTIQYFIYKQLHDATVINIAGRQRMLSQRIARFANRIFYKHEGEIVKKLIVAIEVFDQSHNNLMFGNDILKISSPFNQKLVLAYANLTPIQKEIVRAAKCFINLCERKQEALETINKNSDEFLRHMDKIVFYSSLVSEKRSHFLSKLEICFFALICITMLIEIFLILIPFHRKLLFAFAEQNKENERKQRIYHLAELGELSSEITHEINNFITIIEGSANVLNDKFHDDEKFNHLRPYIDKICRSVERIKNIARGVSKFSRISYIGDFLISDIQKDIEDMFELKFKKYEIDYQFHSSVKHKIRSNQAQITQILFNLIKNAIYAVSKTNEKKIIVDIGEIGKLIEFKVSDSGLGIPDEFKSKVTEAFFTTKEAGKGTGVGLSLSKKIALALGGDLQVIDSKYSTTLSFTIENQANS